MPGYSVRLPARSLRLVHFASPSHVHLPGYPLKLPPLPACRPRYEGEFQAGFAHGLGQFTSESTGEVYIGEFFAGQRHGCVPGHGEGQRVVWGAVPVRAVHSQVWTGGGGWGKLKRPGQCERAAVVPVGSWLRLGMTCCKRQPFALLSPCCTPCYLPSFLFLCRIWLPLTDRVVLLPASLPCPIRCSVSALLTPAPTRPPFSPPPSCGMSLDMKPYFYLLERGVEPLEAYRRTVGAMMRNVEVRTWYRGNKLGDAHEDEVRPGPGGGGGLTYAEDGGLGLGLGLGRRWRAAQADGGRAGWARASCS